MSVSIVPVLRVCAWLLALIGVVVGCAAAPRHYEIARTQRAAEIDLDAWDRLLLRHVDAGVVDYPAFCEAPELPAFIDQVARADLGPASDSTRKGLYVNAYNAYTIQGILEGRSPASLLGRYVFFLRARHPVAGEDMTLWHLEREVLAAFDDPRIHFAIVCASASCPRLRSGAYRAELLDAQLDEAAAAFINDRDRNRFDLERGVAELSSIFDWYRGEFEAAAGSLAAYLARYVEDAEVVRSLREAALELHFLDYDWGLNGPAPGPEGRCPAPDPR